MREVRDKAVKYYNDNQIELMDREDLQPEQIQNLAENSEFLKNQVQQVNDQLEKFRVNEYPSADEYNSEEDYSSQEEYGSEEEYSSDISESEKPRPPKRPKND